MHVVLIAVMDLPVGSNWKGHIQHSTCGLFACHMAWKIIPCDDLSLLRHQVAVVLGNHENYYNLTTTNTVPYIPGFDWISLMMPIIPLRPCHGLTACLWYHTHLCPSVQAMHAVGVVSFAPTVHANCKQLQNHKVENSIRKIRVFWIKNQQNSQHPTKSPRIFLEKFTIPITM